MSLSKQWPWFFDDRLFRPEAFFQPKTANVFPPINLYDDGQSFLVRTEIPGVNKESLEITAQGDQLTIRGERVIEPAQKDASYHRRECESGTFRRTVTLPQPVNADSVSASYANGVLSVTLPRTPEAQPRKISVN